MSPQKSWLRFIGVEEGAEVWRLTHESAPGNLWSHRVEIMHPGGKSTELAIMEVSGDWAGEPDLQFTRQLCEASGLTTVSLYGVPNQPGRGVREDDLIADSFQRFLDRGEPTLLDQMTASVRAAMESVGTVVDCCDWVLTGASKRAWTVWLLAAGRHPHLRGIAPRVFDGLRFDWQLEEQRRQWGAANPVYQPYLSRGMEAEFGQPDSPLMQRVDPYHRLDQIECPVLMITGGQDEFWLPNALEGWWDQVPEPKEILRLPNHGHDLKPIEDWIGVLGEKAAGWRS